MANLDNELWCAYQSRNGRYDATVLRLLSDCYKPVFVGSRQAADDYVYKQQARRFALHEIQRIRKAHYAQLRLYGSSIYGDLLNRIKAAFWQKWHGQR